MSSPEPSDAELLRAHVEGDAQAFGELVRRHQDRLWAVALRTLGDREDAADALQDALVNAFRRAGSYRGDASVTTWLHRVVVNACLDLVRRRGVRATSSLPDDELLDAAALTSSAGPRPGDLAQRTADRLDLEAALAALPLEQRAALVLVDVEGYAVAEAAELLGVPPGTVKSRCSRGRTRMAALLRDRSSVAGGEGAAETGSADTGREDTGREDTGREDTGSADTRGGTGNRAPARDVLSTGRSTGGPTPSDRAPGDPVLNDPVPNDPVPNDPVPNDQAGRGARA